MVNFRGGYTSLQKLIAYAEVLRFCLRHRLLKEPEVMAPSALGIAEVFLKVLELEAQSFERSQRQPDGQAARGRWPGVEMPSSCAQKYMRLERLYISQNQEYDPYSHTLHPHELASST